MIEPTADEIERVGEAARAAWCKGADWPAVARAAILAMDRRASPPAEPFGYWCEQKHADPAFLRPPAYIPELGAFTKVTPLYASPPAPAVAVPVGAIDALADRFWRVHPSEIRDSGLSRAEWYATRMKELFVSVPVAPAPPATRSEDK